MKFIAAVFMLITSMSCLAHALPFIYSQSALNENEISLLNLAEKVTTDNSSSFLIFASAFVDTQVSNELAIRILHQMSAKPYTSLIGQWSVQVATTPIAPLVAGPRVAKVNEQSLNRELLSFKIYQSLVAFTALDMTSPNPDQLDSEWRAKALRSLNQILTVSESGMPYQLNITMTPSEVDKISAVYSESLKFILQALTADESPEGIARMKKIFSQVLKAQLAQPQPTLFAIKCEQFLR